MTSQVNTIKEKVAQIKDLVDKNRGATDPDMLELKTRNILIYKLEEVWQSK